jgi:hypothetical protein
VRTEESSSNIVELSDIRRDKQRALSPYGPVRVGLTTLPTTQDQRLSELLNSLESAVENLNYKSFTAYDTLVIAIEQTRAALSGTQTEEGGTESICLDCGNDLVSEGNDYCLECLQNMLQ